jgi:orotidine-5'-phosphate decarboxylase
MPLPVPQPPPPDPPSDRIIVALDLPDFASALAMVDRLEGSVRWFKVGLELYLAEGRRVVEAVRSRGFSVFLDLKLHDIPNQVASAVRSAAAVREILREIG